MKPKMLTTDELSLFYSPVWEKLNIFFNSKEKCFPCLYAISSFNKKEMYFGISDHSSPIEKLTEDLAGNLKKMSILLSSARNETSKTFNTYVHIIKNNNQDLEKLLLGLLQYLHLLDECEWLDSATKDINVPEFEFCFDRKLWFPVLLAPNHPSNIRRSPYTLLAFQPGLTFYHNKIMKTAYYERMRASIHRRIDIFYGNNKPFYLSKGSEGKNITQFIGYESCEKNKLYEPIFL